MSRWKPWAERVLRWAHMQTELHAVLAEAMKTRDRPVIHECGDESVLFWRHLEDWLADSEVQHRQARPRGRRSGGISPAQLPI